jgi:hypothetical protein
MYHTDELATHQNFHPKGQIRGIDTKITFSRRKESARTCRGDEDGIFSFTHHLKLLSPRLDFVFILKFQISQCFEAVAASPMRFPTLHLRMKIHNTRSKRYMGFPHVCMYINAFENRSATHVCVRAALKSRPPWTTTEKVVRRTILQRLSFRTRAWDWLDRRTPYSWVTTSALGV